MTTWVCADCGTTYDEKTSPCKQCASERLARLEDDTPTNTVRATNVEYRCTECGAAHTKNNPPCNRCGNMTLEAVYDNTDPNDSGAAMTSDSDASPTSVTLRKIAAYAAGILGILNFTGGLIYIAIIPMLFHLVAIYSIFPPARRQLRQRFNIELSTPAAVTIYITTTLVGNIIFLV
jgi:DNA-directed RNA polymerase subunit RPC12/RpoP